MYLRARKEENQMQQCSNTLRCCACGWRTRQKKSCIPNRVCFKTTTSSIINEQWYNDRETKVEDEAERIVETAAEIILSEIRATEYRMENYPSIEDI